MDSKEFDYSGTVSKSLFVVQYLIVVSLYYPCTIWSVWMNSETKFNI